MRFMLFFNKLLSFFDRNIFFGLITMILIVIVGCVSSDNQSNTTEEIPSPPPPAKVTGDLKTEKEKFQQNSLVLICYFYFLTGKMIFYKLDKLKK